MSYMQPFASKAEETKQPIKTKPFGKIDRPTSQIVLKRPDKNFTFDQPEETINKLDETSFTRADITIT
jgi:hypothetical protein